MSSSLSTRIAVLAYTVTSAHGAGPNTADRCTIDASFLSGPTDDLTKCDPLVGRKCQGWWRNSTRSAWCKKPENAHKCQKYISPNGKYQGEDWTGADREGDDWVGLCTKSRHCSRIGLKAERRIVDDEGNAFVRLGKVELLKEGKNKCDHNSSEKLWEISGSSFQKCADACLAYKDSEKKCIGFKLLRYCYLELLKKGEKCDSYQVLLKQKDLIDYAFGSGFWRKVQGKLTLLDSAMLISTTEALEAERAETDECIVPDQLLQGGTNEDTDCFNVVGRECNGRWSDVATDYGPQTTKWCTDSTNGEQGNGLCQKFISPNEDGYRGMCTLSGVCPVLVKSAVRVLFQNHRFVFIGALKESAVDVDLANCEWKTSEEFEAKDRDECATKCIQYAEGVSNASYCVGFKFADGGVCELVVLPKGENCEAYEVFSDEEGTGFWRNIGEVPELGGELRKSDEDSTSKLSVWVLIVPFIF